MLYLKYNTTIFQYKSTLLILFEEVMPVYNENHARPINTKCSL
jgi:hypothetical protein